MSEALAPFDPDAPLFTVTVAARLAEMHPQTLRGYDKLGLVVPQRTKGRGRRYTLRDVSKLRTVAQLSGEGINLEGIRRILALQAQVESLHEQNARLMQILSRPEAQAARRTWAAGASGVVDQRVMARDHRVAQIRALPAASGRR